MRALLIQKDVKLCPLLDGVGCSLRALLIQKDVKLSFMTNHTPYSLRALLIQKDVKPLQRMIKITNV